MRRRERMDWVVKIAGVLIAIMEALWPWVNYTPDISPFIHMAAAAISLPVLYFVFQGDAHAKLQAFNLAMSDKARRLLFLDSYLEPEELELNERIQGALLLPTQRALENALKLKESQSLKDRVSYYYRALPHSAHEADRMGLLSIGHPKTAFSWIIALMLTWALFPLGGVPLMGIQIGTSQGLTVLPLLAILYLYAARANTRFAFELALYNWLRLG